MERIVGFFILMTFLSFLGTVVLVGRGQHWFQTRNEYFAVYNEGYNLQPGSKVKLVRAEIGHVTDVELTEANRVKVTMSILAEYADRIRADSSATIESPTLIGSEFINIKPGTLKAPAIKPGGEIPSREAKKITEYLEEFDFEHKMALLTEVLQNLAELTTELQDPQGSLLGTMSNLEHVTSSIADGDGTLGQLVKSQELYDQILLDLDIVTAILKNLKNTSGAAAQISTGVQRKVPNIMNQVELILEKLQEVSVLLSQAMNDVPEISQRAREGMRDVNDILESVKRNILIRGNLPAKTRPESHGLEIRGQ